MIPSLVRTWKNGKIIIFPDIHNLKSVFQKKKKDVKHNSFLYCLTLHFNIHHHLTNMPQHVQGAL